MNSFTLDNNIAALGFVLIMLIGLLTLLIFLKIREKNELNDLLHELGLYKVKSYETIVGSLFAKVLTTFGNAVVRQPNNVFYRLYYKEGVFYLLIINAKRKDALDNLVKFTPSDIKECVRTKVLPAKYKYEFTFKNREENLVLYFTFGRRETIEEFEGYLNTYITYKN